MPLYALQYCPISGLFLPLPWSTTNISFQLLFQVVSVQGSTFHSWWSMLLFSLLTVLGVYKGRQPFLFPKLNMWVVTVQSCSTYLSVIFMYCGHIFYQTWGGTQHVSSNVHILHTTLRWLSLWDECASRYVCAFVCRSPGAAERYSYT